MAKELDELAIGRFAAEPLRKFSSDVFEAAGFCSEDALMAAEVLIWASLRGVDTHGIRNLKRYYIDSSGVGRRDGEIIPDAPLQVDGESGSCASLNANGGLGLSVSFKAMQRTIRLAEDHGVGIVTVRNSTHFGAAGFYASLAAEQDMIGFASTGYFFPNGQKKAVVPFGGLIPMLSTNPVAMACPAGDQPMFLLDMSTSIIPVNRIEMLEEMDRPIPDGWAVDTASQSTTDPACVNGVEPLGGATSYGGHKGYGLALASWILTGILSGAWKTDARPERILGDIPEPCHGHAQEGIAHCFAAIRLDHFVDPEAFKLGLDSMINSLNDSDPAAGFERVLVPGQPEHEALQRRSRSGIPVSRATVEDLTSLSQQFQIPLPVLRAD